MLNYNRRLFVRLILGLAASIFPRSAVICCTLRAYEHLDLLFEYRSQVFKICKYGYSASATVLPLQYGYSASAMVLSPKYYSSVSATVLPAKYGSSASALCCLHSSFII